MGIHPASSEAGRITHTLKKPADEPNHVRLNGVVRPTLQELGHAPGTDAIVVQEVTPQDVHCLRPFRVIEKGPEALGDALDISFEVPHNIEQIVGVLVRTPGARRRREKSI